MSCEQTATVMPPGISGLPASSPSMDPESPQPLPLTTTIDSTANSSNVSSRCTSPMSPPVFDQNASIASSGNEDESILGINLTVNKSNNINTDNSTNNNNNLNNLKHSSSSNSKRPPSLLSQHHNNPHQSQQFLHHHSNMNNENNESVESVSRHLNNHGSGSSVSNKMKVSNNNNDFNNVPSSIPSISRNKSKKLSHLRSSLDNYNLTQMNSPDFTKLLLEYRDVLLDVLAKSIMLNDNDETTNNETSNYKGIILPIKCQCGYTSELSRQITRTSTYVHQLELKFRSLRESMKVSTDPNRYTPKRPSFINSPAPLPSYPSLAPTSKVSSLLANKKKPSRMSAHQNTINDKHPQISMFSGNSSINSSLNDDDDDDDLDSEEDDVNEGDNLSGNLNDNHIYSNGSIIEESNNNNITNNNGGKTILEGYLESMKNNIPLQETIPESSIKDDNGDDEEDGSIAEEDLPRGPGRRIDLKTKKMVIQLQSSGASFTDISRQIGISRKSVRRIISNFRAYGLLEKKRESRVHQGTQNLILELHSKGRSYSDISRSIEVSKTTISKVIKQFNNDSKIFAKGPPPNGLNPQLALNGSMNGCGVPPGLADPYNDVGADDEDDEEREMVVNENPEEAEDDELDEQEIDDDEDDDNVPNVEFPLKNEMETSLLNSLYSRGHQEQPAHQAVPTPPPSHQNHINKSRRNMSLIQQSPYNNGGSYSQSMKHQYSNHSTPAHNGSNHLNNRLSLIKPSSDRYKPYDLKVRRNSSHNDASSAPPNSHQQQQQMMQHHSHHISQSIQHRLSKSHQIVPPLPSSTNIYPVPNQGRSQSFNKLYNNVNHNNNSMIGNGNDRENTLLRHHHKNKMNRHSVDMPFGKESLIVPEADKNNNTTLANCNVTITSTSSPSNGKSITNEPNNNIPAAHFASIPGSMVDGNSDSETNLVAKNFMDGFPAGIMNSLNPNRATKLTLEDFHIVWQLRSQHWTHNQIRKYFQQRGKSISKSSISRIMNGKQRNFQQFFNVVPSGNPNY